MVSIQNISGKTGVTIRVNLNDNNWFCGDGKKGMSYDAVGSGASDGEANNDHEELGELHLG